MDRYHRDMCYDEVGLCDHRKEKGNPHITFPLTSYNLYISTPISMVSTKLTPSKMFNYLIFTSKVCGPYMSIFLIDACI